MKEVVCAKIREEELKAKVKESFPEFSVFVDTHRYGLVSADKWFVHKLAVTDTWIKVYDSTIWERAKEYGEKEGLEKIIRCFE